MILPSRPRDPEMTRKVAKNLVSRRRSGVKYDYRAE